MVLQVKMKILQVLEDLFWEETPVLLIKPTKESAEQSHLGIAKHNSE